MKKIPVFGKQPNKINYSATNKYGKQKKKVEKKTNKHMKNCEVL